MARFLHIQRASLLGARTLVVAPGLTTRNKTLLVTKGYNGHFYGRSDRTLVEDRTYLLYPVFPFVVLCKDSFEARSKQDVHSGDDFTNPGFSDGIPEDL